MLKLIVSDLDGTLLMPGAQQLEPHVLDVVEKLLDTGYLFVAASGRQYPNLRRMFGKSAERLIYICENGSLVVQNGKVLYKGDISQELRNEIITAAYENKTSEILLSGVWQSYIQPRSKYFYNLVANRMKNDFSIAEDLREIDEECVKLSIYEQHEVTVKQEECWIRNYSDRLTVVRSSNKWLDFMPKGTNKGRALEMIMKKYDISASESIAFGDQDNDVELLEAVGVSYAMSHGSEGAKRVAGNLISHPMEVLEKILR